MNKTCYLGGITSKKLIGDIYPVPSDRQQKAKEHFVKTQRDIKIQDNWQKCLPHVSQKLNGHGNMLTFIREC